jgi:3-dehydroquinate dehydratase-1
MRLQSEVKVIVRNKEIGGPHLLVCLPMVAKRKVELISQAEHLRQLAPDLLEWRVDSYERVEDLPDSMAALEALRFKIGSLPLIYTLRIAAEGGAQDIGQDTRLKLFEAAIRSGNADIVDVEICNQAAFIDKVKQTADECGVRLILSYHNFNETPGEAFIFEKLAEAQRLGADIAKVAVMPKSPQDVLRLLSATLKARTQGLRIPMITMAMGSEGGLTRLAGGLFGSDVTFAVGKTASAPGQIPIDTLRKAMAALYA